MAKHKNGWGGTSKNLERADNGRAALAAAGTDFDVDDEVNFDCVVCDAICNICHYLGSQGWTDEEINRAIVNRGIKLRYGDEKDGTAD